MSQSLPVDELKTYVESLKRIPHLRQFGDEHLEKMFHASELHDYQPGEVIIKEGAFDLRVYFLLIGEVQIAKEGIPVATISEYGEIFGEQALLNEENRSASAIAVAPSYCLSIDSIFIHELDWEEHVACFSIIHRMCAQVLSNRLRRTTAELARLRHLLSEQGIEYP